MKSGLPFTRYAESTPLFTIREARQLYAPRKNTRSLLNMLHRLKKQGRVRLLANGVYAGARAATPLNRYQVPQALRADAVVGLHSALEMHGFANQTFQTIYYFSVHPRKDVIFDNVTYHRVAPPRNLATKPSFQTQPGPDGANVTQRERTVVDCLLFPDYSGGVEELDKSLVAFPSFDFNAALHYLKLLNRPWLYSRLGFLLDRHADKLYFRGKMRDQFLRKLPQGVAYLADKRPGNRWVPTWKLMVPETFASESPESVRT